MKKLLENTIRYSLIKRDELNKDVIKYWLFLANQWLLDNNKPLIDIEFYVHPVDTEIYLLHYEDTLTELLINKRIAVSHGMYSNLDTKDIQLQLIHMQAIDDTKQMVFNDPATMRAICISQPSYFIVPKGARLFEERFYTEESIDMAGNTLHHIY